MPQTLPHGDVLPRLRQVLAKATESWPLPVTQKMVVQATGLDPKTVSAMYNRHTRRYDSYTLGVLCWYFGCDDIGQLLARTAPPGQTFPQLPEVRIGRTQPPGDAPPPRTTLLIGHRIPFHLAEANVEEVVQATGLARNTIIAFLNEEEPTKRIDRRTLAAVCEYLDQREQRIVGIAEVLLYSGPTPWARRSPTR